jgi:CBS domain containing-hemolysin-like protein
MPRKISALLFALLAPAPAFASLLSGETLDSAATVIAWIVLIIVPIGGIYLFWMVHILPEKIAEKNHHPQKSAIKTLCLLSLAFGGMLWPFAWLWAYSKPVVYKLAYGTEKHEDYFVEEAEMALKGELPPERLAHLREELDRMAEKGHITPDLKLLRNKLAAVEAHANAASVEVR